MVIKSISDKILFRSKRDVLKFHLYMKMIQKGIRPFEKDIEILLELSEVNGYSSKEEQESFIQTCLDKKLKNCAQSVRNTVSKFVGLGILIKPRNRVIKINEEFIPNVVCDKVVLQHIISHAD